MYERQTDVFLCRKNVCSRASVPKWFLRFSMQFARMKFTNRYRLVPQKEFFFGFGACGLFTQMIGVSISFLVLRAADCAEEERRNSCVYYSYLHYAIFVCHYFFLSYTGAIVSTSTSLWCWSCCGWLQSPTHFCHGPRCCSFCSQPQHQTCPSTAALLPQR